MTQDSLVLRPIGWVESPLRSREEAPLQGDEGAPDALVVFERVVREADFVDRYPAAMPTRITVRTREGKTYTKQKDLPLGHPGNPMSDQELEDKVRRLVARRLGHARTEDLIRLVWRLEQMKDIGTLMPLLRMSA